MGWWVFWDWDGWVMSFMTCTEEYTGFFEHDSVYLALSLSHVNCFYLGVVLFFPLYSTLT